MTKIAPKPTQGEPSKKESGSIFDEIVVAVIVRKNGDCNRHSPYYVRLPDGMIVNCLWACIQDTAEDCAQQAQQQIDKGSFKKETVETRLFNGPKNELKVFSRADKEHVQPAIRAYYFRREFGPQRNTRPYGTMTKIFGVRHKGLRLKSGVHLPAALRF